MLLGVVGSKRTVSAWVRALCFGFVICVMATSMADCFAETKLPKLFSDGMVLQRQAPIRVWGWDTPGTKVQVALGSQTASATTGDDGKWIVTLPAVEAGGPWELKINGTDSLQFVDVWAGDVWLCSGQSNMEWPVSASMNAAEEIKNGNHPMIRHLKVQHRPAATPQDDIPSDGWKVASSETVGGFTAVGYYFARHLRTEIDVPIGLIGSNWGGTRIEPWTPPVGFKGVAKLKSITDRLEDLPETRPDGNINHQSPLALYNGMIHPFIQMPIKGAIWYQGESNNGEGMLYRDKMEALINGWREVWQQPELPFYFVQLAPFTYNANPVNLAGIWEAQTAALEIPHTGMAVTVDITDLKDIHPTNKQDVGKRLALWALAKTYNQDSVYSGPLYAGSKVDGSSMVIDFQHAGKLATSNGEAVNELLIAGKDRRFFPAVGEIIGSDGNYQLRVSSKEVAAPVAVRFAFHQLAQPNLVGEQGLPAGPFRTDRWDDVTLPASAAAFAGDWTVRFTTPDGTAISHPLKVELANGQISVAATEGSEELRNVSANLTTHELHVMYTVDYQGVDVAMKYVLEPVGNRLVGEAEYNAGGETGTMSLEATKQ